MTKRPWPRWPPDPTLSGNRRIPLAPPDDADYPVGMRPLFQRQTILHSRVFEKARAFLAEREIALDLAGPAKNVENFEVQYNGVYFPGMWVGYIRYGSDVTARVSPQRDDYWIHIPLHGRLESSLGGRLDRGHGIVSSPVGVHTLRSGWGAARLSVSIHAEALMRHLAALLGDAPQAPLRFSPAIDLDQGYGRSLLRVLCCAETDIERDGWLGDRLIASRFEDFVMTGLLLSQPSNYSEALRKRAQPIAPRDVRRAVEYLDENVAASIRLEDVVRECGVPGRTLLKHFQDFKGVSPMRYLRNLRLERVREALQEGRVRQVSEAASRWCFSHPGRFSVEYRRRFGESPSQTLKRSRQHKEIPPARLDD